jgi:NADH-quinone oxidoreductase subunit G/NADP-reducing hydrogenase subunit HndD
MLNLNKGGLQMKMVKVTIDGICIEVEEGTTILKAAEKINVKIPTLCYYEGLNEISACRICMVEVEGANNLLPACSTAVRDGMRIKTNTKRVRDARKTLLNLIISDHDRSCLSCYRNGNCELQDLCEQFSVEESRYVGEPSKKVVDDSTPAIVRDSSKCIMCRRCIEVCREVQKVSAIAPIGRGFKTLVSPAYREGLVNSVCTMCGQCVLVCPTGALTEKTYIDQVWEKLSDPEVHTVIQVAPAIRATIGEEFGLDPGTPVTYKLVTALKKMGFDRVFDTDFTADLTIMEEGHELLDRIQKGGTLPMITSCSPGWIKFMEEFYPDLIDHISTCKSPQQMFGALMKTFYAEEKGIDPARMYTVSVMPCTAKKFECQRPEMRASGYQDVDAVLTTRELAKMIKESGVDFLNLEDSTFDEPFGQGSGAGVIFGATGGVMEAAVRTVYEVVEGKEMDSLDFEPVRGYDGVKKTSIVLGGKKVNLAVSHGLGNIRQILDEIRNGASPYHFIEIMCCPGGCIGGGGQPIGTNRERRLKRIQSLYNIDRNLPIRKSHENPVIAEIYNKYLEHPLSHKSHRLLHTTYVDRMKQRREKYSLTTQ